MESKYPKTLKAAKAINRSGYDVANALWEEVAKTDDGNARKGEFQRVQEFLHKQGGGSYTASWLGELHSLGGWIANSTLSRALPMPPRMAVEARKSRLTPDEAVTQWELGTDDEKPWTLRSWSAALGRKWSDVRSDTAEELMAEAEVAEVGADEMVEEAVKTDPKAVSKAAKKSKAVLDDAYNAVKEDEPEEEEDIDKIEPLPDLDFAIEVADIVRHAEQITDIVGKLEGRLLTVEQKGKLETTARRLDGTAGALRAVARDEAEEAISRILTEAGEHRA